MALHRCSADAYSRLAKLALARKTLRAGEGGNCARAGRARTRSRFRCICADRGTLRRCPCRLRRLRIDYRALARSHRGRSIAEPHSSPPMVEQPGQPTCSTTRVLRPPTSDSSRSRNRRVPIISRFTQMLRIAVGRPARYRDPLRSHIWDSTYRPTAVGHGLGSRRAPVRRVPDVSAVTTNRSLSIPLTQPRSSSASRKTSCR